jgi:hypothetical protein
MKNIPVFVKNKKKEKYEQEKGKIKNNEKRETWAGPA